MLRYLSRPFVLVGIIQAAVIIAVVSRSCYGFAFTTTKPVASVTKYRVPRGRSSVVLFSKVNNGENDQGWGCNMNSNVGKRNNFKRMTTSLFAAILSAMLCTNDCIPFQGESGGGNFVPLIRPSACHALTPDQLLVDDVWREVGRQFFDPTFNGQGEEGWKMQRLKALEKTANLGPDDDAQLYKTIRVMLQSLNDPYTRFLTPEQYESLTKAYTTTNPNSSTKQTPTSGIGVQLIGDNKASTSESSGMVIVANTVGKGPADTAGILPGDFIRSIDGVNMIGATADAVAAKCRGETGTTVTIEIERPPIEGVQGSSVNRRTVVVTRSALAQKPMIEASTVVVSPTNQRVGIVRINSFTQETEKVFRKELKQLSMIREEVGEGAKTDTSTSSPTESLSAIAIDLRGNVGGYMPAGVDVAKLFLPPRARIISEVDKTGRATIYINDGVGSETDTTTPLFVLVDEKTASASEILTAALQDNKRAVVISGAGADKTFGKGRIQNVQALSYGGSGIAVTKARYMTPNGRVRAL